jgi:hypothetical protein
MNDGVGIFRSRASTTLSILFFTTAYQSRLEDLSLFKRHVPQVKCKKSSNRDRYAVVTSKIDKVVDPLEGTRYAVAKRRSTKQASDGCALYT